MQSANDDKLERGDTVHPILTKTRIETINERLCQAVGIISKIGLIILLVMLVCKVILCLNADFRQEAKFDRTIDHFVSGVKNGIYGIEIEYDVENSDIDISKYLNRLTLKITDLRKRERERLS